METTVLKEIITIVGMILTFIIGSAGLIISLMNTRKTGFINTITNSRIKYIQELREAVSQYCALLCSYRRIEENECLCKEQFDMLESIDKLKNQLLLYLNPENKEWDQNIIELVKKLHKNVNTNKDTDIEEFIVLIQFLLKLEWEGAKLESKKGIVTEIEQVILNKKCLMKYHKYKYQND